MKGFAMKNTALNQSGRSMIEMLGVLAIVGVLSVGGIAGYSKAMEKFRQNKTIDAITHLMANIQTTYAKQTSYANLVNDTAIKAGAVPDGFTVSGSGENATISTVYGGNLTIQNTGDTYSIKIYNLPKEIAMVLATQDWSGSGNLVQLKLSSATKEAAENGN